jgi:hypothetical protein
MTHCIQVYGTLSTNKQAVPHLASDLFTALHNAIHKQDLAWLQLLVHGMAQWSVVIEPLYLDLFYCTLVLPLSLEEREPYRSLLHSVQTGIVESEFLYELTAIDLQEKLQVFIQWIVYVRSRPSYDPATLVTKGLARIRKQCNVKQWQSIAQQCLITDELRPFLNQSEPQLVTDAFSTITLDQFTPQYIPLYQRYHNHPALPDRSKIIMSTLLAMQQRHLTNQLASDLGTYISTLPLDRYEAEIKSVLKVFFSAPLSNDDHFFLLQALFVWQHEERFWQHYWGKVTHLSSHTLDQLMLFWFSLQPLQLPQPYVAHHFLLELHRSIQTFQKLPDFQKTVATLEQRPWYLAYQSALLERKHALLTMSQDLIKQVQKRFPNQKVDEKAQQEQRLFDQEIKMLFEPGKIRERHLGAFKSTYNKRSPEQFWEAYKDHFIQVFLAGNAQRIIELLSFWFDQSFDTLGQEPYLTQSFLIGLPQLFELAHKEHEAKFHKMSQQLHRYATQSSPPHWHFLVARYLPVENTGEKKSKWFRR